MPRNAFRARLATALLGHMDAVSIRRAACELLARHLGASRALCWRFERHDLAVIDAEYAVRGSALPARVPTSSFGDDILELRAGKTVTIDDVLLDARSADASAAYAAIEVRSYACVPLIRNGIWVGAIAVHHDVPHAWTPDEVDVIVDTADLAWYAAEHARAEADLRTLAAADGFRIHLADALRRSDPVAMRDVMTHMLTRHLDVNRTSYVVGDGDDYVFDADFSIDAESISKRRIPRSLFQPVEDLVLTGDVIASADVTHDGRLSAGIVAALLAVDVRAFIWVPLFKDGAWAAAVCVQSTRPRQWTQHEIDLSAEAAQRAWSAMETAHARNELRRSAWRDAYRVALTDALRDATDVQRVRAVVCELLGKHLDVARVVFIRIERDDYIVDHNYADGVRSLEGRTPTTPFGRWMFAQLAAGKTLVFDDVATDGRLTEPTRAACAAADIPSMVAIPLNRGEQWHGMLAVHGRTSRAWRRDEVELIAETAERASSAIERAHSAVELANAAGRDAYRIRLADALRPLTDPRDIPRVAATLLGQQLGVNRAHYAQVIGDELLMGPQYTDGVLPIEGRYPASGFATPVAMLRRGRVINYPDIEHEPTISPDERTTYRALDIASALAVGLIKNGELVGVLGVHSKVPRTWTVEELALLDETIERTWLATQRTTAERNVERAARRDAYRIRLSDALRTCRDDREIGEAASRLFSEYIGARELSPTGDGDVISMLRETAERTWSEVERRRAEAALHEANRKKDEFLAMLAHELRNPLAPLRTITGVLRARPSDTGTVHEVAAIMERQLGHLTNLVDDLLDAARISRGTITLKRAHVALAAIVSTAVEAHRTTIRDARLELDVQLPSEPVLLDGDETRLVQVISNILHNATKFTPAGGRITLSARLDAGHIIVRVTDNGLGIASVELPTVFELFQRGERVADRTPSGLGVGLALCKRLVELHGGEIEVHSDGPGRGTQVALRLPVIRAAEERRTPVDVARTGSQRRVLIIDDNLDAARAVALLVGALGGEADIARDGTTGIIAARDRHPDIILLDIGMPGLDGYETCRQLRREHGPALRIIAFTGWGKDEDKQRALEAGFDAHLTKPADPKALRHVLQLG